MPDTPPATTPPMHHYTHRYVRVLSIAGSDSGGGAGIQADLKTCAALGVYGMTAITAITAQNTTGVRAIQGITTDNIRAQIDAVFDDIGADAVKIGMLHAADIIHAVADALRHHAPAHIVLDPVMVATSGAELLQADARAVLARTLFPLADIITPNLDEASLLTGQPIRSPHDMERAAAQLQALGARAVLIKGGHLPDSHTVTDLLLLPPGTTTTDSHRHITWCDPRITTANTHGTGCSLSSAIACYLALGHPLPQAVTQARQYIRQALQTGASIRTGTAHNGPINHGFAPCPMHLRSTQAPPLNRHCSASKTKSQNPPPNSR